jgi:hypothetical protein
VIEHGNLGVGLVQELAVEVNLQVLHAVGYCATG